MKQINALTKVISGLLIVILALWFALYNPGNWGWGRALIDVILGGTLILAILIGLGLFILGISDSRN